MSIHYQLELPEYSAQFLTGIVSVAERVFTIAEESYIAWRFRSMPDFSVFCALDGDDIVGFKAGYAMTQAKYYSWLGGVLPDYRGKGVASALMNQQHDWLAKRHYQTVETAVNQENRAMAQLNIRHGFEVCGIRTEPHRVQVLFFKQLWRSPGSRSRA
jgi:GNAT superfamily N-acetyltransferase